MSTKTSQVAGILCVARTGYRTSDNASKCLTEISECVNNGQITGAHLGIGGIVGAFGGIGNDAAEGDAGIISRCTNNGNIRSWHLSMTGGIIGYATSARGPLTVTQCRNNGNISHSFPANYQDDGYRSHIGGIIGRAEDIFEKSGKITLEQCVSTGSIQSDRPEYSKIADQIGSVVMIPDATPTPKFEKESMLSISQR